MLKLCYDYDEKYVAHFASFPPLAVDLSKLKLWKLYSNNDSWRISSKVCEEREECEEEIPNDRFPRNNDLDENTEKVFLAYLVRKGKSGKAGSEEVVHVTHDLIISRTTGNNLGHQGDTNKEWLPPKVNAPRLQ